MAVIVHGGDLLQPAEAAAHAGSQNNQTGFLHLFSISFVPRGSNS